MRHSRRVRDVGCGVAASRSFTNTRHNLRPSYGGLA
jgi:hypothetical protein